MVPIVRDNPVNGAADDEEEEFLSASQVGRSDVSAIVQSMMSRLEKYEKKHEEQTQLLVDMVGHLVDANRQVGDKAEQTLQQVAAITQHLSTFTSPPAVVVTPPTAVCTHPPVTRRTVGYEPVRHTLPKIEPPMAACAVATAASRPIMSVVMPQATSFSKTVVPVCNKCPTCGCDPVGLLPTPVAHFVTGPATAPYTSTPSEPVNVSSRRKEQRAAPYDGDSQVESFLTQFEFAARYNGWSEDEKLANLVLCLKGKARRVLPIDGSADRMTYEQLCTRLCNSFGPAKLASHHITSLNAMRRGDKESIRELVDRMQPIAQHAYGSITDDTLRNKLLVEPFVGALNDANQRAFVRDRAPATFDDAVDAAELYESNRGIEAKHADAPTDKKKVRFVSDDTDFTELITKTVRAVLSEEQAQSSGKTDNVVDKESRGRSKGRGDGKRREKRSPSAVRAVTDSNAGNRNDVKGGRKSWNDNRPQNNKVDSANDSRRLQTLEAQMNDMACAFRNMMASTSTSGTTQPTTRSENVQNGERLTTQNSPCFNCGAHGHWRNECPQPLKPRRNNGQGNGSGRGPSGQVTSQ